MSKRTLAVLAGLAVLLVAIVWVASATVRRDRAELLARFAAERSDQVVEAAREVEEHFEDIRDDLQFSGRLVQAADSALDRQRELRALLAVVRHYRAVAVFDAAGREVLALFDEQSPSVDAPHLRAVIAGTAAAALAAGPGDVVASRRLDPDEDGWVRVFATPLEGAGAGALAVVVDTRALFNAVRILSSAPDAQVLVLGPFGAPAPGTSPALAAHLRDAASPSVSPALRDVVARMRAGETGTALVSTDHVAAFAPIRVPGGGAWSIATFASTATLRDHERALVVRLGASAAGVALIVVLFAAYLVAGARREVAVAARLARAERAAELHGRTARILDALPSGVMAVDAGGRVSWVNRALEAFVPRDVGGAALRAAFPRASAASVAEVEALVDSARRTRRTESRFGRRGDLFGDERWCNLYAIPLDDGPERQVLLVVEDVSQVHALESQLLRAEKLATIGVLAAGIAHEIGTPLGVVRGRAEYVGGKLGPDHPQSSGMQVIVEQIDRVTRTMRQLLDFARARPAAVRVVEVGPVARAVAELLRYEAERREIELLLDADAAPPLAADPDQLQQVLLNLVMNACDASAPGSRVRVRAGAAVDAEGRACIVVEDEGCGIPAELHHQVFDPFFTTKKRGQGTGLGLTITAQIVRDHGGQVSLDSAPGQGTTIRVSWPTARASVEEAA